MPDLTWNRLDRLLDLRHPGRGWQWLAEALETSPQRVHNWKARGVPAECLPDIAIKLGISTDYLFGLSEDLNALSSREPASRSYGWPFRAVTLEQFLALDDADRENVEGYLAATVHTATRHAQKNGA